MKAGEYLLDLAPTLANFDPGSDGFESRIELRIESFSEPECIGIDGGCIMSKICTRGSAERFGCDRLDATVRNNESSPRTRL